MMLRVGIAGYGVVGKRRRSVVDAHADLQTVAVCDRTLPGTGRFDDGVKHFTHYADLLNEALDVLIVCLSASWFSFVVKVTTSPSRAPSVYSTL